MATSPHVWLCQQIVDNTQDAVICADREGIIRLWNTGAEIIFGYPAAETMGQSLDLLIPEHLRARHWEGYRRVMATGRTPYARQLLAVPGIRKDGTRISLEFTVVLIQETPGEVLGIAAILRDVTERCKPCHHFLYSGGEFVRLYPVNATPTRNYALKTKKQLRVRYKSALDIWRLMSVPHSRLKSPRM